MNSQFEFPSGKGRKEKGKKGEKPPIYIRVGFFPYFGDPGPGRGSNMAGFKDT
jgi:hypothetical protein